MQLGKSPHLAIERSFPTFPAVFHDIAHLNVSLPDEDDVDDLVSTQELSLLISILQAGIPDEIVSFPPPAPIFAKEGGLVDTPSLNL